MLLHVLDHDILFVCLCNRECVCECVYAPRACAFNEPQMKSVRSSGEEILVFIHHSGHVRVFVEEENSMCLENTRAPQPNETPLRETREGQIRQAQRIKVIRTRADGGWVVIGSRAGKGNVLWRRSKTNDFQV